MEKYLWKALGKSQLTGGGSEELRSRGRECHTNRFIFTQSEVASQTSCCSPIYPTTIRQVLPFLKVKRSVCVPLHHFWRIPLSLLAWTRQLCLHGVQAQTCPETWAVKFNLKKEGFHLAWFLQIRTLGRQGNGITPHYCSVVFRVVKRTVMLTQTGICFVSALVFGNYQKILYIWDRVR